MEQFSAMVEGMAPILADKTETAKNELRAVYGEEEEEMEEDQEDGEGIWPIGGYEMTLKNVNRTALGHLLKTIKQEFGIFPSGGAQGIFQASVGANSNEPIQQRSNFTAIVSSSTQLPSYCADIIERCDEKPLWNALMGYGFLIVFCFALIGNCLNLLIYKSDQIRFFIAIRMLCTKLLMNTCMMVVMFPQALRVIRLWDIGGPTDLAFWRFWPYQAYLTNVFGFCAMWLTVLMTAECYVHIFFPSKSKLLCTKQTVWRAYFIILLTALILASIYPLNRDVSLIPKCNRKIVKIMTSQNPVMILLEKVHTIADLFLSILLPLALLVFMTAMIVWRLWIWPKRHWRHLQAAKAAAAAKQNGQAAVATPNTGLLSNAAWKERKGRENHFAAEKRGVTRITLITCFIQLVTETPSMFVLIFVSMFGPNVHKNEHICAWQTISYFLCLCNASLSFFVYITFSTRFRKTMINRARGIFRRLCPFTAVAGINSEMPSAIINGVLASQHKRSHRLPNNSSATPSQMIVLSSRDNSPRNGSECGGTTVNNGKQQQNFLAVDMNGAISVGKLADPTMNGEGQKMSMSTAIAGGDDELEHALPTSCSPDNAANVFTPDRLPALREFTGFSVAKRYLQQKLSQQATHTNGKMMVGRIESDSVLTETTNSMETIPASLSGHRLVHQCSSIDSNYRPSSNSVNARMIGNAGMTGAMEAGGKHQHGRHSAMTTKRSSLCSTSTTNKNGHCDAFL